MSTLPPTPHTPHPDDVLDLLDSLVDRSLVLVDEVAEGMRYRMLETVREFGAEHLAVEEAHELAQRHAAYYMELAEKAAPRLTDAGQRVWLERLEREHDNLRAALRWSRKAVGSGQWAVGSGQSGNVKDNRAAAGVFVGTAHCPLPTAHCPLTFCPLPWRSACDWVPLSLASGCIAALWRRDASTWKPCWPRSGDLPCPPLPVAPVCHRTSKRCAPGL